jgi:hypothetical protein
VGVNSQGDVWLGVTKALTDRHDVHASVDELAGVGVSQGVVRDFGHADADGVIAPCRADRVGREWGAVKIGKQQIATPIPAALPLFAGGLGMIGLLARRRKPKQIARSI